ncbi:hypothetical protein WJX81_005124 [Elliptochloris bilobata]|uniref:Nucleotide-diphospho-sugar transferase domain-containing protein n=1 Tax=Elliptochloris bilobata TaxID=381761 RepID=A0AAW1RMI2_9CHLO
MSFCLHSSVFLLFAVEPQPGTHSSTGALYTRRRPLPSMPVAKTDRSHGGDLDVAFDLEAPSMRPAEGVHETRITQNAPTGNPAPLGLFAFGLTTALLQGAVTSITEPAAADMTYAFGLFYGGFVQLLAGMWEMYKNNTFAATAFSSYGAFWMGFGIFNIMVKAGTWQGDFNGHAPKHYSFEKAEQMMLSLFGILTFIFFVMTLRMNRALQALFFSLALLFFLLAGGVVNPLLHKIAGWVGLWVGLVAFYAATAILTAEVWEYEWLPIGHVQKTTRSKETIRADSPRVAPNPKVDSLSYGSDVIQRAWEAQLWSGFVRGEVNKVKQAQSGADTWGQDALGDAGEKVGAKQGEEERGSDKHLGKPWLAASPHLPAPALEEACYNAAYTDGASGNSAGTVILTSGNKFMLGRLLPRFLKAVKHTLTGDVSNHVVVVALGPSARNVCSGLTARYSHQCVEDPSWDGPEGQYDIGDEWFAAVSMNKLELVLNVMTLGYSVLWMDLDVVAYRNPLPYLIGLSVDVAVPNSRCADTHDEVPLSAGAPLEQDTGLLYADANPRALRFVYDWLRVQRHYRHKLAVEPTLAHDGAIFNMATGPHIQNAFEGQKPLVRIHQLSQDRFSSWCTGPCGCAGTDVVEPVEWTHDEDDEDEGVSSGSLECPEGAMAERLTMHLACAKSLAEKEVLVDVIHTLIEDIRPVDDFLMN